MDSYRELLERNINIAIISSINVEICRFQTNIDPEVRQAENTILYKL